MKFLYSIVALMLLQQGNAFSAQKQPSGKPAAAQASRKDFLQFTSAAALASLVGATVAPQASLAVDVGGKIRYGGEELMSQKGHGTSAEPVQSELLYGANNKLADKICNFNRHFAEMGGYFQSTSFEETVMNAKEPITFYDSVTGKPLFVAPINRSAEQFVAESKVHGWPSFRDEEVVWENVRVLKGSGETVSLNGTHLGHNLPDRAGNRYCINLVSIAGTPIA
eukprot:CAMPEP_0116137418 /NCGR_PEP_ID=MMETSP0329-20121206/12237_1 /TAXON_ID=697910 /ORGANISM="Pseudo-nitzschia arenysensis, Strain B593" /LENGTH=223 /DNA_ID=CAMNT_0003632331 /DNA_START=45 /DNA_END=716 /DNA_ORIENTATION=+